MVWSTASITVSSDKAATNNDQPKKTSNTNDTVCKPSHKDNLFLQSTASAMLC